MPGFTVPMEPICDATFVAQMKKLPVDWKQPQGSPESGQYRDSFAPADHMAIPTPACYFWTQSTNKLHVESCKDIGTSFKELAHDMLGGVKKAVNLWKTQAMFQNLQINALTAGGAAGCLFGPPLKSNIKNFSRPAAAGNEAKWRDAIAGGVSDCFKAWQDKVTVPSLPWYPAFVAFPGPVGPPMPNVPTSLIGCASPAVGKMSPSSLKGAMMDHFGLDDPDDQFGALAQSIGTAVSAAFMAWLPTQLVMNVMATGPIPTWSPPVMPIGPVVAGINIAAPGHLSS
ncbi:MAG: hypothetical protein ACI9WU_001077 [Myxococcota bacterium]|jgi:hypothetical protein